MRELKKSPPPPRIKLPPPGNRSSFKPKVWISARANTACVLKNPFQTSLIIALALRAIFITYGFLLLNFQFMAFQI